MNIKLPNYATSLDKRVICFFASFDNKLSCSNQFELVKKKDKKVFLRVAGLLHLLMEICCCFFVWFKLVNLIATLIKQFYKNTT